MATDWHAYERRKAAWIAAHPRATPEEYEAAARTEFRGERSRGPSRRVAPEGEKRDPRAPALRAHFAADA